MKIGDHVLYITNDQRISPDIKTDDFDGEPCLAHVVGIRDDGTLDLVTMSDTERNPTFVGGQFHGVYESSGPRKAQSTWCKIH